MGFYYSSYIYSTVLIFRLYYLPWKRLETVWIVGL